MNAPPGFPVQDPARRPKRRSPSFCRRIVDRFYTGRGWSRRLSDARLYADPEDVSRTVKRLTLRHLRWHEPKRLYLITLVVRVHADESPSRRSRGRMPNGWSTSSVPRSSRKLEPRRGWHHLLHFREAVGMPTIDGFDGN
jgi:hypothetical protein